MSNGPKMEVAVIGVGRMGTHHARTYAKLPRADLVAVVDKDDDRAETVADQFGCRAYSSTDQLLDRHPNIKAVTVAVPTLAHCEVAQTVLGQRIACLVEKPLAPTVAEAKALADLAEEQGVVLQVGHTERFNPAVRAVSEMNIPTRFMEVQRISPMTFRSLDVGVVLDMMIHDLDIVLTFARSKLVQVDAAGVAIMGPNEDIANARLVFESGCVANLTASRLALKTERKMRLFSEDGYVTLDYQNGTGTVIRKSSNAQALEDVRQQVADGADLSSLDYSKMVQIEQLSMDLPPGEEDPLTAQLKNFLTAAERGHSPLVDGAAGYAAVDAAERVIAAVRSHSWEGLSPAPML